MLIEINDITAPELDVFARLTEAQLRSRLEPEKGVFIAESPKVITTAVENGYRPVSFLMERRHAAGDAAALLARFPDVPAYTAEREVLAHLTGYTLTRGVLCAMRRPQLPDVEAVCAGARRVAVLEGVADSTNVGALFRSAAALGVDAILATPTCCDPFCRRAVRVSMGTVFQVPWTYLGEETKPETVRNPDSEEEKEPGTGIERNLEPEEKADSGNWQKQLHELGFHTVAMALKEDSLSIDDPKLMNEDKLAIVLGTEGDGLAPETIATCDDTVCIPMAHGVDSLNVAAASAVAFWQLGRQAHKDNCCNMNSNYQLWE